MCLTGDLRTASGVLHEIDLVAQFPDLTAVIELKNRLAYPPEKNDVIVFFAKLLDYIALNPILLAREVLPIFMSTTAFEPTGLAACLGLGVHAISPSLRPLPVLIESARLMRNEVVNQLPLPLETRGAFDDFAAQLNRLSLVLDQVSLSSRCGYLSETAILLKAIDGSEAATLAEELRRLNAECSSLLAAFRAEKAKRVTA